MKKIGKPTPSIRLRKKRGFALVVTLTLMVLLSILALGLLSLSSVSLRTMTRTDAEAASRANALLALQLAIGDLQTHLGPDQRISATASVLGDAVAQPKITGVWESNKLDTNSTASDFTKSEKSKRFRKWLVSGSDQALLETENFANLSPGTGNDVVELVSPKNLEAGASVIAAAKVPLSGKSAGSYAYAVIDEGVKARINMGTKQTGSQLAEKSTKLGSGERPNLAGVDGVTQIPADDVELTTLEGRKRVAKMVSMRTSELSYGTDSGEFVRKSHDFTTHSTGVLANVADGGLKSDLNLLAETQNGGTLPSEYATDGIYKKELGASPGPDPLWSRALGWANIFNTDAITEKTVGGNMVGGVQQGAIDTPTASVTVPVGWFAGQGIAGDKSTSSGSANLSGVQPPSPVLLPNIAKVQVGYAITARDMYVYPEGDPVPPDVFTHKDVDGNEHGTPPILHSPQGNWFRRDYNNKNAQGKPKLFNSPVDYMLHLIYTPIITLHNPYNVPLDFANLRVELVNVPFALKIFRKRSSAVQTDPDFIAQTNSLIPFAIMGNASPGTNKRFGLLITDTLLPGEVKIYTPDIDPDKTWAKETNPGGGVGKKSRFDFMDYVDQSAEDGRFDGGNVDTSRSVATPGWNGQGIGYSIEGFCKVIPLFGSDAVGAASISRGVNIPLQREDEIYTEFSPLPDSKLPEKKFSVEMTANWAAPTAGDPPDLSKRRTSAYVFEYSGFSDMKKAMVDDNPQASGGVIRSPKGTDAWKVSQLHDHSQVPLKDMKNVRPIALFSAYAKTGMSGNMASGSEGEDGLYPAKPFAFQNQSALAIKQNLNTGNPAHYSHEMAISRFPDLGIGVQADTGRGKFLSGHSADNGRHFGMLFEMPLAPFQSLVSLNSAQLAAGISLPHFFAPVGNSYVHPLMSGSTPVESGTGYADHSFLLNASLFDKYYLSGIQRHAASFRGGDSKTAETLIESFIASADPGESTSSPLPDTRLRAHLSDGETPAEAIAALKEPDSGYKSAAARQLVDGAFNVNSTSVPAWKAVISSMKGNGAAVISSPQTLSTNSELTNSELDENENTGGARFSRLRIPGGQADREDEDGFWRGPVDIDSDQLDSLAKEIVAQVKLRGPFLSVAEFVNRQLGNSGSDDLAFSGAIQAAIDKTDINTGISAAAEAGYEIDETSANGLGFATPSALAGESTQGAPGYLMQADILAVLGNTVTVRSDTFKIRTYGEAVDKDGNVTARSYCEAVVQRMPEFVDSTDSAETPIASLASKANHSFGRRFQILSLRWLSPSEI